MKITQEPKFQQRGAAMKPELPNPVQLLADLVDALDATYWSSWQSTSKFADQLDAAREYVEKQRTQ